MTSDPPLLPVTSIDTQFKMLIYSVACAHPVSNMLNKLHGQPESYDKKYDGTSSKHWDTC